MSVLIKGMDMPKNCRKCRIECDEWHHIANTEEGRSPTCPLVEVPTPHGDLIDRDKLIEEYDSVHVGEPGKARKLMAEAESVIEAEDGEE